MNLLLKAIQMLTDLENIYKQLKNDLDKKNIKVNILLEYMPLLFELYEGSRELCDNYQIGISDDSAKLNQLKPYFSKLEDIIFQLENFKK